MLRDRYTPSQPEVPMQIILKRDGAKSAKLTKSELDSLAKAQQIIDTLCATDLMPEATEDASTALASVIARFSPPPEPVKKAEKNVAA